MQVIGKGLSEALSIEQEMSEITLAEVKYIRYPIWISKGHQLGLIF